MILLLKVKQMFTDVNTIKLFYDRLNIVVILPPGLAFFSVKCSQFCLTFTEEN